MKIQIEISEEELYFVHVPEEFSLFEIVEYLFSTFLQVKNNISKWEAKLPLNFKYEILGFVKDVIIGEIEIDKNFVLRKTPL